jgi:hypothetical protein
MGVTGGDARHIDTAKRLNLLWTFLRLMTLVPKAKTVVSAAKGEDSAYGRGKDVTVSVGWVGWSADMGI